MGAPVHGAYAIGWLMVAVHTLGYLLTTTGVALLVYTKVGVRFLARGWLNLDLVWAIALHPDRSYRAPDLAQKGDLGQQNRVAHMQLKPDPTFYASPKDAMKAPPETLAYVALLSATGNGVPDRLAVVDTDPSSPELRARKSAASTSRIPATSCITSAGTRAARHSARSRRIRTSSGAI